MLAFAGMAFLRATSPVLGTFVSGEYRTAFATGGDESINGGRRIVEAIMTGIMTLFINWFVILSTTTLADVSDNSSCKIG